MSEDLIENDSINQRSLFVPTPLIVVNGVLNLPLGTIIRGITGITLPSNFLDSLPNANIIQGITLTNPTILGSNVLRSLVVSSYDTTIDNALGNTVLSSTTTNTSTYGKWDSVLSSNNSTITSTSTVGSDLAYCSIIDSDGCSFQNFSNTDLVDSVIMACSNGCAVTAAGTATGINNMAVIGSNFATVLQAQAGQCINCGIYSSRGTTVINNSSNAMSDISSLASIGTAFTASSTSNQANVAVVGSNSCNVLSPVANSVDTSCILGCNNSSFISSAGQVSQCALIAGNGASITAGTRVCCIGTATSSGFTNNLVFNGTGTASNQALFGSRVDITGAGNNLTVSGYASPAAGVVRQAANVAVDTAVLSSHDAIHVTSTGAVTLTLPTAASLAATYPTGTYRTWYFSQTPTATPGKIATSGGDLFKNKTGFSQITLPREFGHFEIAWTNVTGTPGWTMRQKLKFNANADMTTANNFGTGGLPKSDAAQLATSTSKANHLTLGSTTYIAFDSITSDNPQSFTLNATPGALITCPVTGYYRFKYQYNISQTATVGVTYYILRSDIRDITGSSTVLNSYAEIGGENLVSGTKYVDVVAGPMLLLASNQYALRVTQDSTQTIVSTASLIFARLEIIADV